MGVSLHFLSWNFYEPLPTWTLGRSGKMGRLSVDQVCWTLSLFSVSSSQGLDAVFLPPGTQRAGAALLLPGFSFSIGQCCWVSGVSAFYVGTMALSFKAFSLVLFPTSSSLLPSVTHCKHSLHLPTKTPILVSPIFLSSLSR